MDTKSRDIKYSLGAKIAAAFIVCLCFVVIMTSGAFLIINNEIVFCKSYYETNQFEWEFARLVNDVVELNIELKSEENIRNSDKLGIKKAENLQRLHRIQNRLAGCVNLAYYIKNDQTGEVVTNVTDQDALSLIQSQPTAVRLNQWELDTDYPLSGEIPEMLSGTPYEVYAAVVQPLKAGDVFYGQFQNFSWVKAMSRIIIPALIASIILLILAFIYLVCVAGRREKGGETELSFIDRVYADVQTLLVFLAALISIFCVAQISHSNSVEALIIASIVWSIDAVIGLTYVLSMVRQIKSRRLMENTLIFKACSALISLVRLCFDEKVFKAGILILLLVYGLVNGILFAAASSGGAWAAGLLLIAFNAAALYYTARALISLTEIMGAVKEVSAGNLDYSLEGKKISDAFAGLVQDLQSIQGGLKKAVAEAVKGERMKTDLITNVSHDLKTPLTSIVNYVDLLKKEELNNERAYEYVHILEEKSGRLKQLIEDLVEASKASSGNLAVKTEKVDLNELVMQACGEYEEKIRQAGIDMRINSPEKSTLISADGKYMWRIFENLLSNALKYSMPGSRVYIDINKNDRSGVLTIKSVSANPLDISPEQLTERFVRGDASRTTEGSGLGLSIAQSLTVIQGGRFKIEIDGDLFKVTVEMPLWSEE